MLHGLDICREHFGPSLGDSDCRGAGIPHRYIPSDANALMQRSSDMPEASQDTPVLDTIAAMTAVSVAECELTPDALLLVRLAALAAVEAPPVSYLLHVGPAAEAGVTIEDAQNVLVAVAPIIGTARTMAAAINIAEALELAIEVIAEGVE